MAKTKYQNLKDTSKTKYTSTLVRLERSGITVKQAKSMSDKDLKQALGFTSRKKSSFDALKRNINGISLDLDRKQAVRKDTIPKFVKLGYRGKGLNLAKRRLTTTLGMNVFFDIAKEVQKQKKMSKSQSIIYTRDILNQAKIDWNKVKAPDKAILSFFS